MSHPIGSFLTSIVTAYHRWRLHFEISGRLSPHVRGERDGGYPFNDETSLAEAADRGHQDAQSHLATIEREAPRMGQAYGNSVRYLLYRDLNRRLARYQRIVRQNRQPETCDPRWVARKA